MKTIEKFIHIAGRFVFGFGASLALAFAVVIVSSDHVLEPVVPAVEVVRLEPIVVTISAERFDAIFAEAKNDWMLLSARARKADAL